MKKQLLSVFATLSLCFSVSAQTTVTVTATGVAGSFNTGSVNSAGTKNDGNMININQTTNAGWARFDMTLIPAGAVVMSANCVFTTYTTTSSGAVNNLYGFVGDPSVIPGATLYTNCNSGTSINSSTWTANATNTKTLNATGVNFVQTNITSNQLCIGFSRASTNNYNIYGYPGTAAQQPMLVVTYSVPPTCAGAPNAGTVVASNTVLCAPQNVNLSLTGSTSASGLTYQWFSSPDGTTWSPIPTATNVATTQSVTATTYYQCTVACGTNVATSTTLTVNYGVMPTAGLTAASTTLACFGQAVNLTLTGAGSMPGLTYQWQSSPTGTGYTAVAPSATLAATTQTMNTSLYFQNVLTCGTSTAVSTPIQVMVASTTTNTVPYFEGFEGITTNNQLPNCSWMASNLPTICQTYSTTPLAPTYNRIPKSGTKFGSFRYGTNVAGDYFYTNGVQLTAGVNYQASADYITDGLSGWSEFRLLYGTSQSTVGLNSIAAATGSLTNTVYNNLLGTFSVSTTGLYYIAVKAIGNSTPWYLTFDDLNVIVAPSCVAPTAFNSTGITASTASFTWTAGASETSWDVFVGSNPTGTTVPTATTTTASYTATGLSVNNTYSVYVRANCGAISSTWVLSTVYIGYCAPAPSSVDNSGIINVNIANGAINNSSLAEPGNYGNYSVQTATVFQGASVPVVITYSTGYTYETNIWIDYNDDLDFNDAGESVYSGTSTATMPTTLTANVSLSLTAPLGTHRLRIGGQDNGPVTPCYNGSYGTFEDYSINIQPAPACTLTPLAGTISGPSTVNMGTANSYTISPIAGNIQWYTGTSATGPWTAISGATTSINQTITAIGSGTVYYTAIASNPGCVDDTANTAYPVNVIFVGDNVCNAIPLMLGVSTTSYSVNGATTQTGEVVPPASGFSNNTGWGNNTLSNSLWFTFVAPASGYVTVQSPDFDTQLAIWKATSCSDLLSASTATLVAANDDDASYTTHGGVIYSSFVSAACLTPGATYYVQLDSYNSPAAPNSSTRVLVTDMGTALDASFTGLASNYCIPGASATLTPATAGGDFTINTFTTSITSFSTSTAGTYTVNYTVLGCKTMSVTVVANTPTVMSMTSNTAVCAGSSATLSATGATNYTWTNGGTAMTEVVTPTATTVYTVTGEDSGCSNTSTVSVGYNMLPSVSAMASNTLLCSNLGESAVLTASTSATSYTWSNGANTMTTTVTPSVATTYTLMVNDGNCDAMTTIFIDVQTCLGINNAVTANSINIYPNPTNGILNITISSELAGTTSIEVYDALGKIAIKETLTNETTTINTSKLTDGMYVYKVINNNNAIKIGKIVKH